MDMAQIAAVSCPTCGGSECIEPAEAILDSIFSRYMACGECMADPQLQKDAPFWKIEQEGYDNRPCTGCGKRHLDVVMADALSIMIEYGCRSKDSTLFDVGTPLISVGYPLAFPPRLKYNELVLIADNISRPVAAQLIRVPEIKGVVKREGTPSQSVGIQDTDCKPHTYELLAGCDMRCDVVTSSFGELCIYKSQSKIHIEFGRESPTKMQVLERLYVQGHLMGKVVVDGFCGPGTLGLMCALAGARRVIFNDAWKTAIENTLLNIEINKDILGFELTTYVDTSTLPDIGENTVHVASVEGDGVVMDVFHGDFRKLKEVIPDFDICLIDTFPSVDPAGFVWDGASGRIVIV
jgi:hypothetical protein